MQRLKNELQLPVVKPKNRLLKIPNLCRSAAFGETPLTWQVCIIKSRESIKEHKLRAGIVAAMGMCALRTPPWTSLVEREDVPAPKSSCSTRAVRRPLAFSQDWRE